MTFVIDLESPDFKAEFLPFLNFFLNKPQDYMSNTKEIYIKDLANFRKKSEFFTGNNLWLLKPAGRNRGIGIYIFNDLLKLNEYLQNLGEKAHKLQKKPKYSEIISSGYTNHHYKGNEEIISQNRIKSSKEIKDANPYSRKFVLQKYMESPLLVKGRKFDIRAWVLLDHKKNLYLFRYIIVKLYRVYRYYIERDIFEHLQRNMI